MKIGSVTVKGSDEVELLEITIGEALNFKKTWEKFVSHCLVQGSCFKMNQEILNIR